MNIYERTKNGIEEAGFNSDYLEDLAKKLASSLTLEKVIDLYPEFEDEAEKLPWPQDRDFGALVLQSVSVSAPNNIATFMLSKAKDRAHWCASCATSGGEGLARAEHIKELESELSKYN
jgi:hypothetical protein